MLLFECLVCCLNLFELYFMFISCAFSFCVEFV